MDQYNPNSIWTGKQNQLDGASDSFASKEKHKSSINIDDLEEDSNVPDKKKSHGLLWFFIIVFTFLAGGAFYFFFLRPAQGPTVTVSFDKPDQVYVGDPFTFSVLLSNNSQSIIRNANIELVLPDGFYFVGQSSDTRAMPESVGDINIGDVVPKQDFHIISTGQQNSVGRIVVKVIYQSDSTGKTQFETDNSADVINGSPALGINFILPQNVFSGQSFPMVINYKNNTSHDIPNATLQLSYPSTFIFLTSTLAPILSNGNSWNIGTVKAFQTGSITITGILSGPSNTSYPFSGSISSNISGSNYTFDNESANVSIAQSPLSISISLNNTSTYIGSLGDYLGYTLTYQNNSNIALQNVVIQAILQGNMYDFSNFTSNGSLNSLTNTVTWSQANDSDLALLNPGQSGSVQMGLNIKKSFPTNGGKNYKLKVQATITSPTIPQNTSASSTIGMASLQNKIGGLINITSNGYRNDLGSGITNNGPYPPQVNQQTQYTIHWKITNYSTDVSNVTVSAYLQPGSVWTGQVKSNINILPTYDSTTGLVTWVIPGLSAGVGVNSPQAEAVFQIANTPSVNQVGQQVTLIGQTNLTALDTFTGQQLQSSADQVTSYLGNDSSVSNYSGIVVQ
jgi:uncharacterized repeat protein (TIGR01451 family)